jgi:hypothetical protein
MGSPFSVENITEVFGADAADIEDPARLYTFFLENDSYKEVRAPNPVTLVVGQKGIGKTALMLVSSFDDRRANFPNIFIRASKILSQTQDSASPSQAISTFRGVIEQALVDEVVGTLSKEAAMSIGTPAAASNIVGTLARLGSSIIADQNDHVRKAAQKIAPWLLKSIRSVNVYIDDTDVDWDGSPKSGNRIAHLIQACFQIAAESQGDLRFKISIRSDLYNYLSTTSDLIDKIQSGVVKCRWTNDQIFRVIAKRIAVYDGKDFDDEGVAALKQEDVFREYFTGFFEPRFLDTGAWENVPMRHVLLSFVRQRPRDLIGLCQLAGKAAAKNNTLIDTDCIKNVVTEYSNGRFNDTVVEFKNELPEIEKLLYEMRPLDRKRRSKQPENPEKKRNYYSNDELMSKLKNISERIDLRFSHSTIKAKPADLANFLFKINFLVASRKIPGGQTERMYYDFSDEHLREVRLGKWDWEVHMAYRWAIQHDPAAVWKELD